MNIATPEHCCSYVIDRRDRLVAVDDGWKEFASDNHCADVFPERILRTCLWDYISGMANRLAYKKLLDCGRRTGEPIHLTMRCDSPSEERWLEVSLIPLEDQCCVFETTVLQHQSRPPINLLDPTVVRSSQSVEICSWCMNLNVSQLDWLPIRSALLTLDLDPDGPQPHLVYTMCPDCSEGVGRILMEHDYAGLTSYRGRKKEVFPY